MNAVPAEKLVRVLSREEIAAGVRRLAQAVDRDYAGRSPLLIGVLRGAFIFLADLVRQLQTPVTIEFLRLATYGKGTVPSEQVQVVLGLPDETVKGRDVLLVEDIVDTGVTTKAALAYLGSKQPASLKLCALLDKPARRRVAVPIHYRGFTVPGAFLVGYGLDVGQRYRQLPDIYRIEEA